MTALRRLAVVGLCSCALAAWGGEPKEIVVTGETALGGDKAQARDKAIQAALRAAVEQACGTLVAAETQVRNSQLVSDRILTKASGYVSGYDVVSEKEEKGVVSVTVKAKVGTDKLADDLAAIGLTLARKGMPRIAVLVSEQAIDDQSPKSWWAKDAGKPGAVSLELGLFENGLAGAWTPEGFTFVDHATLGGALAKSGALSSQLTDKEVQAIGEVTDADVVVLGKAIALPSSFEVAGVKKGGCTATIAVAAKNADTRDTLASAESTQTLAHPVAASCGVEVLKRATEAVAKDLKAKLLAAWQQQLAGGGTVTVLVKGADLGTLKQLKANLGTLVRGVKAVDQKRFDKGVGELAVRGELSAEALGDELDGKKVKKQTIKVTSVTANKLELELVK